LVLAPLGAPAHAAIPPPFKGFCVHSVLVQSGNRLWERRLGAPGRSVASPAASTRLRRGEAALRQTPI